MLAVPPEFRETIKVLDTLRRITVSCRIKLQVPKGDLPLISSEGKRPYRSEYTAYSQGGALCNSFLRGASFINAFLYIYIV